MSRRLMVFGASCYVRRPWVSDTLQNISYEEGIGPLYVQYFTIAKVCTATIRAWTGYMEANTKKFSSALRSHIWQAAQK